MVRKATTSECAVMEPIFIAPPAAGLSSTPEVATATTTPTLASMAAVVSTTKQSSANGHKIPSDILDDLASRFIINVPDDERNNLIRICFQIELAHWFYLDFFCSIEEKKLVPCGIKQFAIHLFHHIPFLRMRLSGIDKILEDWKEYKLSVPTYGAILMSEDLKYVLLVQSYWAKSSWGFPKGKVNEHEDPIHCATREVFEETGYDITGLIAPNDYIEAVINYQYTRLYLVRNVPLQTLFSPRTRKEIKCCEWFPVDSLPTNKNDATSKTNLGINANSFFMIMPFIKRLKKWVHDNRSGINTAIQQQISVATTTTSTPLFPVKVTNGRKNTDVKINTGNFALNMNSNSYKNSLSYNGKRQRHKSMGDIDSIKINITNNNSNNNFNSAIKLPNGTKTNLITPNNVIDTSNNDNVKREKYSKMNSKRQLFNSCSISSSGSSNSSSGSIGSNSYVYTTSNSITTNNSCNFDIKKKIYLENTSKCTSTPLTSSNNSGKINGNSNKIINKCKSKTTDNNNSMQIDKNSLNSNVSKMSPNLDSWTSFTFTKNFIANVFC